MLTSKGISIIFNKIENRQKDFIMDNFNQIESDILGKNKKCNLRYNFEYEGKG